MDQNPIRYQTVRLIGKLLHPLTESNLITIPEYRNTGKSSLSSNIWLTKELRCRR